MADQNEPGTGPDGLPGMRTGYLTGEYPRVTDTFVQREITALRREGVDVRTFSIRRPNIDRGRGPEQEREQRSTTYLLPISPFRLVGAHAYCLFSRPGRYFRTLQLAFKTRSPGLRALLYQLFYFAEAGLLARRVNQLGITHIHNHFASASCSVAMLAAEMGGFTFSFTIHGPAIFFEPIRWNIGEKTRHALFVCCISYFCRSQAMIFAPLETWKRLHIVHCGVDPEFYPTVMHVGTGHRLLFVGRIAAVKGLPILLEAIHRIASSIEDVQLTIVGDGPDRTYLETMTIELGLSDKVSFVGYRTQEQVRDHLTHTDIFVLPSFAEGVPVVLMEAMASGIPVVTTRIAGISELVEDSVSGFTVPAGDAGALAERIALLIKDTDLRTTMGEAGRTKVEGQFHIQREAQWLRRIMSEAREGRVVATRPVE